MFTNYVADIYKKKGKSYISTTSNPSMIRARKRDPKWIPPRVGRKGNGSKNGLIQNSNKKGTTSNARITV